MKNKTQAAAATSAVDTAVSRAQKLNDAMPALQRIDAIDARLAEIAAEQKSLGGALPPGEIANKLANDLAARAHDFDAGRSPWSSREIVSELTARDRLPGTFFSEPMHVLALVLALFTPEELDERVQDAVKRWNYPHGRSAQERQKLGGGLAEERAALVAEREPLVEAAKAAGADIAHLPETTRARQAAIAQAKREEDQRQRQAEILARVDADDVRRKQRAVAR